MYEVPLSMFFGGDGGYVSQLSNVCIMVLLRAVLNMLVKKVHPRGTMCFRCEMFSLSKPGELLYLLSLIASWT